MPKGEDIDPAEAHSMLETDLPVVALAEALQATGAPCLSEFLLHAESPSYLQPRLRLVLST